jgi:site-specific recombinase XerD
MLLLKNKEIEYFDIYRKKMIKGDVPISLFFTGKMKSFEPLNQYFIHKVFFSRAWASENTISTNSQHLLDFFLYIEDNEFEWDNLNNDILVQWRDNIKKEGILGKPLKNSTVNTRLQAVISFYDFCLSMNYIQEHPFIFSAFNTKVNSSFNQKNLVLSKNRAVSKLTKNTPEISIPTLNELSIFLAQKMPIETRLMCLLMYETGMRKEEVYTLNYEAIYSIKINEKQNFYNIFLDNTKMKTKGSKDRTVVIGLKLLSLLQDWYGSKRKIKLYDKFEKKHQLVPKTFFITNHGNYYKNDTLNSTLERICENAGFNKNKITPHALRHSFATHNLVYNLDKFKGSEERMLQWLCNRLGHSNPSTTREHYIHFVNDLKIKEQDILTDFEKKINGMIK